MILQALYEYYQRSDNLPRPGLESKEFKYLLQIEEDGTFADLTCELDERKRGKALQVPRSCKRSGVLSEDKPFLLWDSVDFVLGESGKGDKATDKDRATALRKRANFTARLAAMPDRVKAAPGIRAVLEFYRKEEYAKVPAHALWQDLLKSNSNLTFCIRGRLQPVVGDPEVIAYVMAEAAGDSEGGESGPTGRCLITGNRDELIRLMGATPIPGSKSTSSLIGFQKNSGYDSYGKEQCYNAPMGKIAEFACSTALNALLGKDSHNRTLLGGVSMLYWTQKAEKSFTLADLIPTLIRVEKDDPNAGIESLRAMLKSIYTGKVPADEAGNRFYFLGLAPNAARISVAFWKTGTVAELCRNLDQHYQDFDLEARQPRPTTIQSVLASIALEYKIENLAPNLESRFVESVIDGSAYPVTLLIQAIGRIRADRKFPQLRIAAIKAYLNRKNRLYKQNDKEITMSLDPENPSLGYQCGRLFAVLEKAQSEALPGINSTIADRFYGAAASTPVTVFGRLIALSRHHLEKLLPGRKVTLKKLIGEIIGRIPDFPAHLNLEEQGRFAIGYYHQNQELYKKSTEAQTE